MCKNVRNLSLFKAMFACAIVCLVILGYENYIFIQSIKVHEQKTKNLTDDLSVKMKEIKTLKNKIHVTEAESKAISVKLNEAKYLIMSINKNSPGYIDPNKINRILLETDVAKISYIAATEFREKYKNQYSPIDISAFSLGLIDEDQNIKLRITMKEYFNAVMRQQQKHKLLQQGNKGT